MKNHINKYKVKEDLPLIVPIVFYNGISSPYPYKTKMAELFLNKELFKNIGLGSFNIVDLTVIEDEEILKHGKIALLETIEKHIWNRNFNVIIAKVMNALLVAKADNLSKSTFNGALSFLVRSRTKKELAPLIEQIKQISDYKEDVMSYAEELILEGKQEGIKTTQVQIVRELLNLKVDESIIIKAANLSKMEFEKIKKSF